MYEIKTLNSISKVYKSILDPKEYTVGSDIQNPDAIMVRSADMHSYETNPELLCVGRAGAGVNNLPLDDFAKAGIVAFNSPGANANAVKELVIAGLLLASRKITDGVEWCRTLSDGDTTVEKQVEAGKKNFVGPEIAGKTLGVIGLGAIGVEVANTAVALGMNVLGYDPYISIDHAWRLSRSVSHITSLDDIYKKADYITVHVPLMDATRDMINADAISKMKKSVALLNFARDGLVNVPAVKEALANGSMRIYVTDFPSAELIGVKGVLLTPHLGASTPESEDNCVRMVAQQIKDYIETGSIVNSVNFPNCRLGKPSTFRVAVLHRNIPNVIGPVTRFFGEAEINIENMVNMSRGDNAYTVVDLDKEPAEDLLKLLGRFRPVYRVRLIKPE